MHVAHAIACRPCRHVQIPGCQDCGAYQVEGVWIDKEGQRVAEPHPDYLAVPEERRWGKPLNELFPTLRREAWSLRGGWSWRCLPHGALVAVRIVPPEEGKESAFNLELRIARKTPPADEKGWQKWSAELVVFLKHLSGEAGDWQETSRSTEKAEATFRFLVRGKPAPKCSRCGTRAAVDPGKFKTDLCNECAMELGAEDAARLNAGHQRELL